MPVTMISNPIREHVIIMPKDAENYACELIRSRLLGLFGGYTEHDATGAWRAPDGEVIYDHNAVFTVATDRLDAMDLLRVIAEIAGRLGHQQSVYLSDGDGTVEFVNIAEETE